MKVWFLQIFVVDLIKAKESGGWKKIDDELLVYESKDLKHSSKIASFDLDGTIITTKSGYSQIQTSTRIMIYNIWFR